MSTINKPLKYLFRAVYEDGSEYLQPKDDVSRLHKGDKDFTPSSFRDIDQDKLVAFYLTDGTDVYGVNLKTGDFSVNGKALSLYEQNFDPYTHKLRLIYFREVHKNFNVNMEEVDAFVNRYIFGWQCTDKDGKNHQLTVGIK